MTIQIDVVEETENLIRLRIESGAFRDASDVVADAVRHSDVAEPADPRIAKKNFYDFIRESPLVWSGIVLERRYRLRA